MVARPKRVVLAPASDSAECLRSCTVTVVLKEDAVHDDRVPEQAAKRRKRADIAYRSTA